MSEHSVESGLRRKWCHWCGDPATGTALDALYTETGQLISRLGGRFASCAKQHGTGYSASVIPPASTPGGAA